MINVCSTIAHPQFGTMWLYVHFNQRKSGRAIIPSQPKFTMPRRSGLSFLMVGTWTASSTASSLGPTYIRSTVGPRRLPTAAPTTSTVATSLEPAPNGFKPGFCGISMESRSVTIAALLGSSGIKMAGKVLVAGTSPLERAL